MPGFQVRVQRASLYILFLLATRCGCVIIVLASADPRQLAQFSTEGTDIALALDDIFV